METTLKKPSQQRNIRSDGRQEKKIAAEKTDTSFETTVFFLKRKPKDSTIGKCATINILIITL